MNEMMTANEKQIDGNLFWWRGGGKGWRRLLYAFHLSVRLFILSILFSHTVQMSTLNALSLNNTRRAENQIVVFNRVPKVGSQTFMELLRRLALRNNFKFHRDSVQRVETIRLATYQQEELAEMVSELPTPSGNKNGNLMLLFCAENCLAIDEIIDSRSF